MMVSSAGILLVHTQSTTSAQRTVSIGLPAQILPVSELAGAWNIAVWDPLQRGHVGGIMAEVDTITFDAAGQVTGVSTCLGLAACVAVPGPFPRHTANATNGGFDMIENGLFNGRMLMFRNLTGRAAIVFTAGDGQWFVGMRGQAQTLPAVGAVSNFRQFSLDGNGTVSTLTEDSHTGTAVDTSARTATRLQASDSLLFCRAIKRPDGDRLRHGAQIVTRPHARRAEAAATAADPGAAQHAGRSGFGPTSIAQSPTLRPAVSDADTDADTDADHARPGLFSC